MSSDSMMVFSPTPADDDDDDDDTTTPPPPTESFRRNDTADDIEVDTDDDDDDDGDDDDDHRRHHRQHRQHHYQHPHQHPQQQHQPHYHRHRHEHVEDDHVDGKGRRRRGAAVGASPHRPPHLWTSNTTTVDVEWNPDDIREELREAVIVLSHHCLKLSAKWASENLVGLVPWEDRTAMADDRAAAEEELEEELEEHPSTPTEEEEEDEEEEYHPQYHHRHHEEEKMQDVESPPQPQPKMRSEGRAAAAAAPPPPPPEAGSGSGVGSGVGAGAGAGAGSRQVTSEGDTPRMATTSRIHNNGGRIRGTRSRLRSGNGGTSTSTDVNDVVASLYRNVSNIELYAKSLMEMGEYGHAASVLSELNGGRVSQTPAPPALPELTPYGIYLRAYALYMAGEQERNQHLATLPNDPPRGDVPNRHLPRLAQELAQLYADDRLDAFGLYVYGVVLSKTATTTTTITTTTNRPPNANRGGPSTPSHHHQQNHQHHQANNNNNKTKKKHTPSPRRNNNNHHHPHHIKSKTAQEILLESLELFPCNWSAWLDLANLCTSSRSVSRSGSTNHHHRSQNGADADASVVVNDEMEAFEATLRARLGHHYMYHFYCAHVDAENQAHEQAVAVLEQLIAPTPDTKMFCSSSYLASKLAVAHYHLREFDEAQNIFQQLVELDPYRLEDLDIFSNILFVQDQAVALSQLAHTAMQVDKYRPESCCIVGNYYSLKNQRTKAIHYFQRALKLDRNYTGAWTLMGHEYVELKNTPAAMEAYRRAADISPKDYRAWYGLGQAYEFLQMPLYALYYFRRAASLRTYDARMWCAVGNCYLALHKTAEAIRAFERAIAHQDHEGIATNHLANLYKQQGQTEQAAQCYRNFLQLRYWATTPHPHSHSYSSPPEPNGDPYGGDSHDHGTTMTAATTTTTTTMPPIVAADAAPSLTDLIQGVPVQSAAEATALLFLAHYHMDHHEYETAALCASRLLEYPGPEKEEGKALLREIRSSTKATTTTAGAAATSSSTSGRNNNNNNNHPSSRHVTSAAAGTTTNAYARTRGGGGGVGTATEVVPHVRNPFAAEVGMTTTTTTTTMSSRLRGMERSGTLHPGVTTRQPPQPPPTHAAAPTAIPTNRTSNRRTAPPPPPRTPPIPMQSPDGSAGAAEETEGEFSVEFSP